jgi:hypothetical protein
MGTKETGEPTIQKKQKTLTIQESSVSLFDTLFQVRFNLKEIFVNNLIFPFQPADNVSTNPTATAPSGEGQRDKEKANDETSEASMPPIPKKKVDKEKRKKKKVKSKSKPLAEPEKETETPPFTSPVEDQPTANVETPNIETSAPRQEKTSSCSHDLGAKVKFSRP